MRERRFTGKLAEKYDLYSTVMPYYKLLQKCIALQLVELTNKTRPKILEVGVGSGQTTEAIFNLLPKAYIFGVDDESEMLSQAENKLKKYLIGENLSLEEADALAFINSRLAEFTGFFDAIASGFTIHNFEQSYRHEFLQTVYDFLPLGGLFVNGDKYSPDDPEEYKRAFEMELNFIKNLDYLGFPDVRKEWTDHQYADEHPSIIMYRQQAMQELREIGFVNVHSTFEFGLEAVVVAYKPE